MRTLIINPHIFPGGAEKVLLNLAHHLEKRNVHVDIASLTLDLSKLPRHLHKLRYIVPERKPTIPGKSGLRSTLASALLENWLLADLLRGLVDDYDLLNPHNFPAYWAAGLTSGRKPVAWHCNEVLGPYGETKELYDRSRIFRQTLEGAKRFDRLIVDRKVNKIITCSNYNRRLIEERYGREAEVVNTCIDFDFFREEVSDAKRMLGLGDATLLLQVGSLIPRKNQIVSIQATKLLKERLGSVRLALVGEGSWKPTLKRAVSELHLEEEVAFLGQISEQRLRCLYHACDVNLYPVQDQTWGLVPFEAMAAGKPSVVSRRCGASEIFKERDLGPVVEPSAPKFAKATLYLLGKTERVEDIVQRGRGFIRENLTYDKYADKILKIFKSTLQEQP